MRSNEVDQKVVIVCVYCKRQHFSASCETVKDINQRKNILLRDRRCFTCLKTGHPSENCRSTRKCRKCSGNHHQSICHKDYQDVKQGSGGDTDSLRKQNDKNSELPKSGDDDKTGEHMRTVTGTVKGKNVLLQTATVMACNENSGKGVPVRILLDCGSQRSYVTNCLKSELDLKAVKTKNVHLNTFGDDKFKKTKMQHCES